MNRVKYSLLFVVMAAAVGYIAFEVGSAPLAVVLGNVVVAFILVALAYALNRPGAFMKRSDGRWPVITYVLLWPYLLLSCATFHLSRLLSREHPFDHIEGNVYLGRRLTSREARTCGVTFTAVLDLTCEFPECAELRKAERYLSLPVLDTLAPTPPQLRTAIDWLSASAASGPTYVHCASGHGRSAAVVVAWMLYTNPALTVKDAIARVQEKRPDISLTPEQISAIANYKK